MVVVVDQPGTQVHKVFFQTRRPDSDTPYSCFPLGGSADENPVSLEVITGWLIIYLFVSHTLGRRGFLSGRIETLVDVREK